jgi:predicted nucleic acid-binding protein
MIVVDTNVIAYLLITGERNLDAERALHKDPTWAAPILWRSELRNVLALYMRQRGLSVDQAVQIIDKADELLQGREYVQSSRSVLELVAGSVCSAYDCEFVALAQDLSVPLVTDDRRILNAFPETAISLIDFLGHADATHTITEQ